jgi:formylglycine-generating enzyme required for sulfatase activity
MQFNSVLKRCAFLLFVVFALFAVACGDTSGDEWSVATAPTMKFIPAGTFQMGQGVVIGATPVQSVTLTRGFYMGIYPVTQAQYAAVMAGNANSANPRPSAWLPVAGEVQARLPVEMVSWYEAIIFCNRLSMLEGLTPVYSIGSSTNPANWGTVPGPSNNATWDAAAADWDANGYRLPTEAEWEYACRAGTTTQWYTGNTANAALDAAAWYAGNSGSRTRQVGLKTPNAFGLYDMHGNVNEWCWDWFGNYTAGAKTDPQGAVSGANRVLRGGCWGHITSRLSSASRYDFLPSLRFTSLGFRLVRNAP